MAAVTRGSAGKLTGLTGKESPAIGPIVTALSNVRWCSLRGTLMLLSVSILVALGTPGIHSMPLRVYLAARAETFNLVEWEAHHLASHAATIGAALSRPPTSDPQELERIHDYLLTPRNARSESRWDAERAIERELSAVINDAEIAGLPGLPIPGMFPPVAFRFTSPPAVLIVAPRDRLVVQQSLFLEPAGSETRDATVEERVEALGLSSLVTPIGGLATYPSMVVESSRATEVLSSVAHEWVHAYLFFRPLGATYWSSQQGRAINETVADLAGRELGEMLAERAQLPAPQPVVRGGEGPDRVFQQEMRTTRLETERLLAMGEIEEAELYMERRRLDLEALGYRIRRLNQAYFAFHGSYAEGVAGDNRLGSLVRSLRTASPSLAAFLASASSVQSADDLRRLVDNS